MGRVDPKKIARDVAARRRLASRATPGLPIDADVVETRVPMPNMGGLMDGILSSLMIEKSSFFDEVCEKWTGMFPDSVAKPGRWQAFFISAKACISSLGNFLAMISLPCASAMALLLSIATEP